MLTYNATKHTYLIIIFIVQSIENYDMKVTIKHIGNFTCRSA